MLGEVRRWWARGRGSRSGASVAESSSQPRLGPPRAAGAPAQVWSRSQRRISPSSSVGSAGSPVPKAGSKRSSAPSSGPARPPARGPRRSPCGGSDGPGRMIGRMRGDELARVRERIGAAGLVTSTVPTPDRMGVVVRVTRTSPSPPATLLPVGRETVEPVPGYRPNGACQGVACRITSVVAKPYGAPPLHERR